MDYVSHERRWKASRHSTPHPGPVVTPSMLATRTDARGIRQRAMAGNIQKLETSDRPYLFQHIYKRALDKLKSYYRIRPNERVAQAPTENASAELPASPAQELIDMRSAEVKARWFGT